MAEEKKAPTKKYRVKEGHVFGAEDQFLPGDIVELTDTEARGFEEKKAPTKKYRVKEGHVFGAEDQFLPGDIVELTDTEARGFLDTVEPVDGKPAPVDTE